MGCLVSISCVVIALYLKELLLFFNLLCKSVSKNNKDQEEIEETENDSLLHERLIHMPPHIIDSSVVYQTLPTFHGAENVIEEHYRILPSTTSGCVKIIFFFYQASAIIRIQSPGKLTIPPFPKIFDFLSTFSTFA